MRRRAAVWLLLIVLLPLAGCLPTRLPPPPLPDAAPDVELPVRPRRLPPDEERKKPGPEKEKPTVPAPQIETVFSLGGAVAYALRNNPRLGEARARVDASQAQVQIAAVPLEPQLDLLSRYVATSTALGPGAPGPTGGLEPLRFAPHQAVQAELQLRWLLCDFGLTRGLIERALSHEKIATLRLTRAGQAVALDAASAYCEVLMAGAAAQAQEEAVRNARAIREDAAARRDGGTATRDAVLRTDVLLAEARQALVHATEQQQSALARLNNALGRDASLPLEVLDLTSRPPQPPALRACLEQAAGRPEITIARAAVAAATAGRDAAEAAFCPKLFVMSSLGVVDGQNVRKGRQEGVGVHLNQPLYHGGKLQAELRAAEAELAEAIARERGVGDGVTLEVTVAHRHAIAAREQAELSVPAVRQAEEALRLLRVKFRNGDATPTDVIDADTALTRARLRAAAARYGYLLALARLDFAIGNAPGTLLPLEGGLPS